MCLAIPAKIEAVDGDQATVNLGGNRTDVSVALTPSAKAGDWVLVHAGIAIALLDATQARETYELLRQVDLIDEGQ